MSEYTAEDFKNARFAVHESGRAHAMRLTEHEDDPKKWMYQRHMNPHFTKRANDAGMAADGWRPVREHNPHATDALEEEIQDLRDRLNAMVEENICRRSEAAHTLEALLSDDVIERAAREVYGEDPAWGYVHDYGYGEVGADWSQLPDDLQEKFRVLGRNALEAALGIEGEQ